jgi:hypothetical protein
MKTCKAAQDEVLIKQIHRSSDAGQISKELQLINMFCYTATPVLVG